MGVVKYYYKIEKTKERKIEKPIFEIKSNILFDIATLINVEIEVPISKRISVAAETMFPQWNLKKQKKTIEAVTGNLELKVWLGNRQNKQHMVGWYIGAYGGGGGKYTLMLNQNHGFRGKFYVATGVSAGYAHTINKKGNLRMEYSVGVGYLTTLYNKYAWCDQCDDFVYDHFPRQNWRTNWIGLNRAKVSLRWMLNKKNK